MRILVCGGRDYNDTIRVFDVLDLLGPTSIVQGGQCGADALAAAWAFTRDVPQLVFRVTPQEWFQQGKSAGHRRNTRMLAEGLPDLVLAFPGGRGTANMVMQARAWGVPVVEASP